ncbi:hypothetical protein H5410_045421 [Solanum commersonii]|uniref:Uncharacterized protein n=1 Tax=Solanum commersonii TaxID=4109 RepID=A0A9J5X9K1_SOLCO|nr:hypothetical protein H5410_045421 [Solanum commersonii]
MGILFLLAFSISSRRVNSLLHFLKCVLSRLVPLCVPVVTCFMVNLHFVQVTIVFSSFCTNNFIRKDLLARTMVFEKVGKEETSSCSGNSVAGIVRVGVSSSSSFISTSSSNSSSKLRWQIFRIRTTFSSPIIFSFRHWSFTTIFFQIHVQVQNN